MGAVAVVMGAVAAGIDRILERRTERGLLAQAPRFFLWKSYRENRLRGPSPANHANLIDPKPTPKPDQIRRHCAACHLAVYSCAGTRPA
jgi:hypothetical protein